MLVFRFLTRLFLAGLRRFLYILTPFPLRGGTETIVGALYIVTLQMNHPDLS